MAKEIYVLSDIHLGAGGASDWYIKGEHDQNLLEVLRLIGNRGIEPDTDVELVLAGDIFDTWLCQVNETPVTISDILDYNTNIVEALSVVLNTVNIFYINGNHDMHVTIDDLDRIQSQITGNKIQGINEFRTGRAKIEHGHRFSIFNAKDKVNDPLHGLPIGYFITRLCAGDESYKTKRAIAGYVDDLLEAALTTQTFSESIIEALAEFKGLGPDAIIKMPFGRRDLTIKEVKSKYKDLFSQWIASKGFRYTLKSIEGEGREDLGWFADKMAEKHDYKIVILGHTHSKEVDEDGGWLWFENRVYANSGTWVTSNPSYVRIVKGENGSEVSLFYKNDNQFENIESCVV